MKDLILVAMPNLALADPEMYFDLGILYLAAVAEKAGFTVGVLDFRSRIDELPPARFYGFSCATPHIEIARQLAKRVNGQTIVGGAHPSLLPQDCVGDFDYVVVGEGETVLPMLLSNKYDRGIVQTARIEDLDKIPYPAWDKVEKPFSHTLFPGEKYGFGAKAGSLIASRGCPYNCSFCGNIYRTPVTYRSADNIRGELLELMKRGVYHFRFEDDNFTLLPQFDDLCLDMRQLGIHYKCHTRSNLLTVRQAELMKWSGCEECGLGVESADDDVLKLNNKGETAKDHARAVKILKEAGLRAKTYFMTGLPGETDKTIELNKQFMIDVKPDRWTVSTFTPYPGCAIYERPEKFKIKIINRDWKTWWNFVVPERGKQREGEEGFNHILEEQTKEEMEARHNEFYEWLREEKWK